MYFVTWLFAQFLGRLPDFILVGFAHGLSILAFDVLRIRRRLIIQNIAIAFPEKSHQERVSIGRASLFHFASTILETIQGGPRNLIQHVEVVGESWFEKAFNQKKGVYLVCVHMGNFEVLGAVVSTRWSPLTVPVKYIGQGGFDRYVHAQRTRYRINPVRRTTKGSGFRAIKDAILRGEPAGFMLDQARHGEPKLDLFGKPAKTNTSVAAIWFKSPAPLVPVFTFRKSFGHHVIEFWEPVVESPDSASLSFEERVLEQSKSFNRLVEKMIRSHPEQYWWIHNRWK